MYIDSCILVKLLVREPDSEFFVDSLEGEVLLTSELAQTEVFSAMLSRERAGSLGAADRRRAWKEFESRVEADEIRFGPFSSTVLRKARHILDRCHPQVPLRTLDAIHIATAELCHDFPLVTTDRRMRDAAQLLGIPFFPSAQEMPGRSTP